MRRQKIIWVPTPTFLYRNYHYKRLVKGLSKDSFFLDVGSGNGEFVKFLLDKGFCGEAIDISHEAVWFFKKQLGRAKGIKIIQGDVFKYKPAKKYDVVFCFETLEHIKDDAGAIKKIYSFLRPGGMILISVPAHMSEWDKMDEIKGHYRRYEKKEVFQKLRQAGFQKVKVFDYGFPFLWILRRITKTGKLITFFGQEKDKESRSEESSIQQEYNPKLKPIVANPLILYPMFKIMDLFIGTDLGFGYIAYGTRQTGKKT